MRRPGGRVERRQQNLWTYSNDRPFPGDSKAEHPDLVVDLADFAEGHDVEGLGEGR